MMNIVFLDTETTGLDARRERIFEVGIIAGRVAYEFHLQPEPEVVAAIHPKALEINRYHERTTARGWVWDEEHEALTAIAVLLDGVHICGAVPDFDTRFITATFQRAGIKPPEWHYHLIDVETLAVGWLLGRGLSMPPLPWGSDELSRACGVEPPGDDERHTALGDARWCKRLFETISTPESTRKHVMTIHEEKLRSENAALKAEEDQP